MEQQWDLSCASNCPADGRRSCNGRTQARRPEMERNARRSAARSLLLRRADCRSAARSLPPRTTSAVQLPKLQVAGLDPALPGSGAAALELWHGPCLSGTPRHGGRASWCYQTRAIPREMWHVVFRGHGHHPSHCGTYLGHRRDARECRTCVRHLEIWHGAEAKRKAPRPRAWDGCPAHNRSRATLSRLPWWFGCHGCPRLWCLETVAVRRIGRLRP